MHPYIPPEHVTQNWALRKPAARGRRGMVVSQSADAAAAGLAILDAGGSAADAAVGAAFALAVAEPWNSGLGGTGFALVHPAGETRAQVVDFGPVAPRSLDPARFPLTGQIKRDLFVWPEVVGDANIHGPLSPVTPSAVAGYAALHARWGRLPLADVMGPAIALARRGLPQDWHSTLKIASSAATIRLYPESARIYLDDGLPPVPPYQGPPGYRRMGKLADTLAHLARAGLGDFYRGDVARGMAADIAAMGGLLTEADFAACEARIVPAAETAWAGVFVQGAGGLTAFPTLVDVLGRMGAPACGSLPDAGWFVRLAAALRAEYAERLETLGAATKADDTCTTHVTVCDDVGDVVSMTTTLLSSMGSRVVLPSSGVLLNNGVMWFDPRPGTANAMAPGRRPLTNMLPVIVRDEAGRATLAGGASGGRRILASVAQMLAFVAGFGMDVEAAAHHPRIDVSGPDSVGADRRLPPETLKALARTAETTVLEDAVLPINFACPNMIALDANGERTGISDVASPWSAALAQG